mgnify:CR=1 FL=1
MQIVIENIIDFDILIHFDIIIETAPNLNKTKILFFCFFPEFIGDILNFKSARLKVNSLSFYENAFYIEIASKRFSLNGGAGPVGPRKRGRACPPFSEKNSL